MVATLVPASTVIVAGSETEMSPASETKSVKSSTLRWSAGASVSLTV